MHDIELVEEWKPIADWPAYSVSNQGRIRRDVTTQGGKAGRILKCSPQSLGYLTMQFYLDRKTRKMRTVHDLVAEAFIGPKPAGLVVNHKNGVKSDNRACNLEYCTPLENSRHAIEVLGHDPRARSLESAPRGESHYKAKVRAQDVYAIRAAHATGGKPYDLGKRLGLTKGSISAIIARKSWKHI